MGRISPRWWNVGFGVRLLALPAVLSGCANSDPLYRAGYWHPRGINSANLTATIAEPHDLVEGRSTPYADGTLAAAAVDRLYRDKVKAPPTVTISSIGGAATTGASSGAAGADSTP